MSSYREKDPLYPEHLKNKKTEDEQFLFDMDQIEKAVELSMMKPSMRRKLEIKKMLQG